MAVLVQIDDALCKGSDGCGICIAFCPRQVLAGSDTLTARGVRPARVANPDRCNACRLCMIYCPDFAVVVVRDEERHEPLKTEGSEAEAIRAEAASRHGEGRTATGEP